MRALIALLALAALTSGCLSSSTGLHAAAPHAATATQPHSGLAAPSLLATASATPSTKTTFQLDTLTAQQTFTLHVDHLEEVRLRIDFDQAAGHDLALDGPGDCANQDLGIMSTTGTTGHAHWSFPCGVVFPGDYPVTVSLDVGLAEGTLTTLGGVFTS